MSALLLLEAVTKKFGGVAALNGVSIDAPQGSITGVIGPNGAGKTTLFNVITGACRPTSGEVRLRGRSLNGLAPHEIARLGVARTFQNIRLFRSMTVWEHLMVGQRGDGGLIGALLPAGIAQAMAVRRAERALELFGLQAHRHRLAATLPYGLQRKVEMARALTSEPELLLLDEPVAGMNHDEAGVLRELIQRLREGGLTVLLIEHDMPFVMNLCDRLFVLDFGSLIACGAPHEVRRDPLVLEAYLGSEA
jgi:branched-chain amino acid transport system ATP-binding protein